MRHVVVNKIQSNTAFLYPFSATPRPIDPAIQSFITFLQFNPPITLKSCTTTRSTLLRRPLNSQHDSLDLESTERELDLGFSLVAGAGRDVVDFKVFLMIF
jgi:hypothetical protein